MVCMRERYVGTAIFQSSGVQYGMTRGWTTSAEVATSPTKACTKSGMNGEISANDFDGYVATEFLVLGFVDQTSRTFTDLIDEFVA